MHAFPHRYVVQATGAETGAVELSTAGVEAMATAAPREFDGPGDRWSPETLLVGAVADCFILTFRAVARASQLPWTAIRCEVAGTLDRVDRVAQFTAFDVRVLVEVPSDVPEERARLIAEKAERACLVSNSLKADRRLVVGVRVDGRGA